MKLSGNALKWIAIFAMFSDHIARSIYDINFLSTEAKLPIIAFIMLSVGKITAPIMFFFIAEGFHKTRNVAKYALRLGIFAIISHIPYNLFINNVVKRTIPADSSSILELATNSVTFAPTSVIFTLFLAVLALIAYESKLDSSIKAFTIFVIIMISGIGDWGIIGVVLPLIFHVFRDNNKLKWSLFFASITIFSCMLYLPTLEWSLIFTYIIGSIVSSLLIQLYSGKRGLGGTINKWAFYIIYPLHMLIIWYIFISGGFSFVIP